MSAVSDLTSFTLFATVVLGVLWVGTLLIVIFVRDPCSKQLEVLHNRLKAYAYLKSDKAVSFKAARKPISVLSAEEHEILLGVLKKVEAKNGTMVTFWALITSGLIAFMVSSFSDREVFGVSAVLFVGLIPFLVAALRGTRQIDNFSSPFTGRLKVDKHTPAEMQKELLDDVLMKENCLFVTQRGAVIYLIVAGGLIILLALEKFWQVV